MIKVLLVNEQRLFNEAIESLLSTETDIHVVGMTTNGQDTMKQIAEKQPDVVLLDLQMSTIDSIKATVHMKDNYPEIKVIFLTTFSKKEYVIAGILAGADGFLLKNIDSERLLQSIRNAYSGQIVISGEAARILAQKVVELAYDEHIIFKESLAIHNIHLSDREVEISLLMVGKFTNREIAQKLYLTEGTIRNYISEIYSKLNVFTRNEAIEYLEDLTKIAEK